MLEKISSTLFKLFRKFAALITSRFVIVATLIILQVVWVYVIFFWLSEQFWAIKITTSVIGALLFLVVVNREEVPEYKMPWLVIITISPLFGAVLYFFFGSNQPGKLLKREYLNIQKESNKYLTQNEDVLQSLKKEDRTAYTQANYIHNVSRGKLHSDLQTQYFPMGDDAFPVLLEELQKAKRFIFMEYFILEEGKMWNSILDILVEKAKAGVEVRVMYDDIGCIGKVPAYYIKKLRKLGLNAQVFRPFRPFISVMHNNRDHRKITVIDNEVAFVGGFNLADEYINVRQRFGKWKDTSVMLKGGSVSDITTAFLTMWYAEAGTMPVFEKYAEYHGEEACGALKLKESENERNGYTLFYTDGPQPFYRECVGKEVYLNLLRSATEYVYITTPYLICDNEVISAIRNAAQRGVDVRLITPAIPDKKMIFLLTRSSYHTLVEAGVKIYEYTPGFIHAKTFVCDDKYAVVSTINLDYRSMVHHFECGVWMYKTPVIGKIKSDMVYTFMESRLIKEGENQLNPVQKLVKSILQIFAPML